MELDINHIEEVVVKYLDGQELVFRGRGLEKFRTLIKKSPPLKLQKTKRLPKVVEEVSSEEVSSEEEESSEEASESSEEISPPAPRVKNKKAPKTVNGYNTVHLNYGDTSAPGKNGLSPHDIAKNMQRQAETISGIRY